MSSPDNKQYTYSAKETLRVLLGIPIVVTVAIFCANFATSYAGI